MDLAKGQASGEGEVLSEVGGCLYKEEKLSVHEKEGNCGLNFAESLELCGELKNTTPGTARS